MVHSYSPINEEGLELPSRNAQSFSLHGDDISVDSVKKNTRSIYAAVGGVIIASFIIFFYFYPPNDQILGASSAELDVFDHLGRYVLRDYDRMKPMSNFLNGLGGLWGVPMWAFYVNRGQGIASFGKQNKDGGILQFKTANVAYQETPFTGFRTFLKGKRRDATGVRSWNRMPFYPRASESTERLVRNMYVGISEMEIEEIDQDLDLKTNVLYFTPPDDPFPSLIRRTTFTNTDTQHDLHLDVLDGLGQLTPAGLLNANLDSMGRTQQAWMRVYNVGDSNEPGNHITQPFFHISQGTADSAQVQIIEDGYFSVAFIEQNDDNTDNEFLPFVVDPYAVYGFDTTLTDPTLFYSSSAEEVCASSQGTSSRTPCAFAGTAVRIPANSSVTISSIYGYARNIDQFLNDISPQLRAAGYVDRKREGSRKLVEEITEKVESSTGLNIFDEYVKQNFLDNVLRGGLPIEIGRTDSSSATTTSMFEPGSAKIFHVFSRIHGDIERDYNNFQIATSFFSEGPGNFRDVSQNRRMDVFHTPAVKDFNIRMFLSFVQADGYNPLTVASTNFKIPNEMIPELILSLKVVETRSDSTAAADALSDILAKPFRPGSFFKAVNNSNIKFEISNDEVISLVIRESKQVPAAAYAQNGYWADHWEYTMDLLENFVSIYPDLETTFLWDEESIPFYMSSAYVKSRDDRYTLIQDPYDSMKSTIRVYNAVASWGDPTFSGERQDALNAIYSSPDYVADSTGSGGIWQRGTDDVHDVKVSPIAKLMILGVLKFSTLDPMGMGIEMEGGKPGWNDAMNGLPGLLGSGMPESFEALRILRYVRAMIGQTWKSVSVPAEFSTFLTDLRKALLQFSVNVVSIGVDKSDFLYWDETNSARESYRTSVIARFSGDLVVIDVQNLIDTLDSFIGKMESGINKALSTTGGTLSPTYFWYQCESLETIVRDEVNSDHQPVAPIVRSKSFSLQELPLFLEGPTRQLKITTEIEDRRAIYRAVRNSDLYDSALEMYTICASLAGTRQDVGRMMAFSPGWLENESVWLHMAYKFYLELLRGGLYEEFFIEIRTGLVPFMNATLYGRSPTEASSFIVSSAFPDERLHGSSFLARLSGSTAEFLSMWAHMMAGPNPFTIDDKSNSLQLIFKPVLPSWMFDTDNQVSFTFLGCVKVVYSNPNRQDTWTTKPKSIVLTDKSGHNEHVLGSVLSEPHAYAVRNLEFESILVQY